MTLNNFLAISITVLLSYSAISQVEDTTFTDHSHMEANFGYENALDSLFLGRWNLHKITRENRIIYDGSDPSELLHLRLLERYVTTGKALNHTDSVEIIDSVNLYFEKMSNWFVEFRHNNVLVTGINLPDSIHGYTSELVGRYDISGNKIVMQVPDAQITREYHPNGGYYMFILGDLLFIHTHTFLKKGRGYYYTYKKVN